MQHERRDRIGQAAEWDILEPQDLADLPMDERLTWWDRYGWDEAEATKPERYRTAQIDEADHELEL